jgi:hypothetical protein
VDKKDFVHATSESQASYNIIVYQDQKDFVYATHEEQAACDIDYKMNKRQYFLQMFTRGIVQYGIFSNEQKGLAQSWQSGGTLLKVNTPEGIKELNFKGYSSSRATVFNMLSGSPDTKNPKFDKNCFDVRLSLQTSKKRRENVSGAVTYPYLRDVVAPYLNERGTHLIFCSRKNQEEDRKDEDAQIRVYPSLAKDSFAFPSDIKWKEKDISERYNIAFSL